MFPIVPANSAAVSGNQEGIFGFGDTGGGDSGYQSMTNLVSNTGVVSTDVTGVGTVRRYLAACEYGEDKGIFGFGNKAPGGSTYSSETNLVSNAGVVASDQAATTGTARRSPAACSYGEDKGIFGFGYNNVKNSMTNLVSNTGVVASDVSSVGDARYSLAACEYGDDKGIFGFGIDAGGLGETTNLVSNVGVVASDVTGIGTPRYILGACDYGGDKGIFGFGEAGPGATAVTNKVSNGGIVSTDTTGVGTARNALAATQYGGNKGIFGFGQGPTNVTNLVSNTGVVASDQAATTGTARDNLAACSFN